MNSVDSSSPRRPFRPRFSLLALLLFMTAACLLLYWLSRPRTVVVIALLHVDSRPSVAPATEIAERDRMIERDFEIVQRTQLAYLRDPAILQTAVGNPRIAKLPLVSRQADPVAWLQQQLEPQFQRESEILSLRLAVPATHASDGQALLGAVVTAYLQAANVDERQRWQAAIQECQAEYDELRAAVEQLSKKIAVLRAERGPDDPEARLLQLEADRKVEAANRLKVEIEYGNAQLYLPPPVRLLQPPMIVK